VTTVFMARGR